MPIATTYAAIRAGVVTAIKGTLPSYEPRSSERWRLVDQRRDVPSVGLRSFFVELKNVEPQGDVYGGCGLHRADLYVWTSYVGTTPTEAQVLIAEDQQDLWRSLHRAEITGAPKYTKAPFEYESEEMGRVWGAHLFIAEFFLPLP